VSQKRLEARVYGFVQGVGFRYFVRKNALRLGLHGYAKNLANGSVEVIAEGKEENLFSLVSILKKGNAYSSVESVEYKIKDDTEGLTDFEIY
jgi:acylphosphatase